MSSLLYIQISSTNIERPYFFIIDIDQDRNGLDRPLIANKSNVRFRWKADIGIVSVLCQIEAG